MHLKPAFRGCHSFPCEAIALRTGKRLCLMMGASAIILFGKSDLQVLAQGLSSPHIPSRDQSSEPRQAQSALWVNPQIGDDTSADGSEKAPFRTLTYALETARSGAVIYLAPGIYSTDTGEVFPIALKPGITIQGNSGELGQGTVIRGGGSYSSPTMGSQNVTLIGASQVTLSGVTVTNPRVQGHGLWIEVGSPTIRDNTFINSTNAGLVTAGSSAPIVQNNLFVLNRTSGMVITGHAQPQVQDNIFQRTGSGITVSETASPQLINNRISQNRDGIVIQGNASPVLRSNTVEDSARDGIVVMAQAQPNLGTATEPGNNTFLNNQKHDINALATNQTLPAFGNQLASTQLAGKVDLTGNTPLVTVATVASAANRLPITQVPRSATSHSTPRQSSLPAGQSSALISSLPPITPSPSQPERVLQSTRNPSTSQSGSTTATSLAAEVSQNRQTLQRATPSTHSSQTAPSQTAPSQTASAQTVPLATRAIARSPSAVAQPTTIEIRVPPPERTVSSRSATPTISRSTPQAAVLRSTPGQPPSSTQLVHAVRSTPQAIEITVPPPEATPQVAAVPQFASVAVAAAASLPRQTLASNNLAVPALGGTPINIPVPPPERGSSSTAAVSPAKPADNLVSLLPVPNAEIPLGNTGDMPRVNVANAQSKALLTSQAENLQYRVLVEAEDEQTQSLVKSLVPGAFTTLINGQSVMQIGAFSSHGNAQEAVERLSRSGLQGIIQPIE